LNFILDKRIYYLFIILFMLKPNFFTHQLEQTDNFGKFVIDPLPRSFGQSLGNALRRTLLSSLKGAAVVAVKIKGVPHLFATLKGIKESALELTLNLKQLRFTAFESDSFVKLTLEKKGAGKIYGKDFKGEIQVINKDIYLGEITDDKVNLEIEILVACGVGYINAEESKVEESGFIPVDAFFSPVKKVEFKVEEARVGRKTDADKLILEITTDGSLKPVEALRQSALMLADFSSYILSGNDNPQPKEEKQENQTKQEQVDQRLYDIIIDELNLPSRVINALLRENIETVADLIKVGREKLTNMKGVGKKSIELIEEELKKMNINLDQ